MPFSWGKLFFPLFKGDLSFTYCCSKGQWGEMSQNKNKTNDKSQQGDNL